MNLDFLKKKVWATSTNRSSQPKFCKAKQPSNQCDLFAIWNLCEKAISAQIGAVKSAIVALGDMRPGHLSFQRRANGRNPRCYAQLSYTFKKRSRTDYVQPDDVDRVKAEIENYRKFKSLCERLVELSIEASKLKSEKRKRQTASSTGQK